MIISYIFLREFPLIASEGRQADEGKSKRKKKTSMAGYEMRERKKLCLKNTNKRRIRSEHGRIRRRGQKPVRQVSDSLNSLFFLAQRKHR
jgi:hypothetical protein